MSAPAPQFVGDAWRAVLRREVDPGGYAQALRRLDEGGSRRALLSRLARSDEARSLGVDPGPWPAPSPAIEQARRLLVWPWAMLRARARARQRLRACPVLRPLAWEPTEPASSEPGGPPAASGAPLTVFTIVARNYLPQARVLMASVARHHPEAGRVVVVVDAAASGGDAGFECLDAAALGIDGFPDMTVRYDVLELSTAVKPFAFRQLLGRSGVRQVVYLDPDIELHARLEAALRLLDGGAPIVLTPHATEPLPGPGVPDDHTLLRSGVFNLGFMAARPDPRTDRWVAWWSERLRLHCRVDFAANLFTDQRWCDLAPCFVDGLAILRDPGCNVAYWNLEHRRMVCDGERRWKVDGAPLVFFHFSGFDPGNPSQLSRHQTRLPSSTVDRVAPLLIDYARRMHEQGWDAARRQPYGHDAVDAQGRLGPLLRRFYRWHWPEAQMDKRQTLLQRLLASAWTQVPGELPPLLSFLHASDEDLRCAFDIERPTHRARLLSWFIHHVMPAEGLDTLFTPLSLKAARSSR